MAERNGRIPSEIPYQLTHEPQIGDVIKSISLTPDEWRNIFQKMGEAAERDGVSPRGFDFRIGQENMGFETHGFEDQSMAKNRSVLVTASVLDNYSLDGLLQERGVLRGGSDIDLESRIPSSVRAFTYRNNNDGTFTVVEIVDTLIQADKQVIVAKQTLENGEPKQETTLLTPKLQETMNTLLDSPFPLSNVSIPSESIDWLKQHIEEEQNPAITLKEMNGELKLSFSHILLVPQFLSEYIETQTVTLVKNQQGNWETHYQSWDYFSPTGKKQPVTLDSQEIEYEYANGIYVRQKTRSKGQDFIFEEYKPVFFPVLDKKGKPTTRTVEVFDIERRSRNPNDPTSLPLEEQPLQKISFVDYVLLRSSSTGKRSNFGVIIEDKAVVLKKEGRRTRRELVDWKVLEDGKMILNPDARSAIEIERTLRLPTQQVIKVTLKLDSTGEKIDQSQTIPGVILGE